MLSIIESSLNDLCPIRNLKITVHRDEWLTNEVIEAILEKDRLHKAACKSNLLSDWEKFKIARKRSRNLLLNTKEEVLKSQVKENYGNPGRFWRKINEILGNGKHSRSFSSIYNDQNVKLDNGDAAEFMNEYYTRIGEHLNANNNSTWHPHQFFSKRPKNEFSLNVITEEMLKKYIKRLDISKPSGIPYVNNKVLRDALISIPFELLVLINNSIVNAIFPTDWKNGIITPIPKTGNLMDKTNWRPITILNSVGKLLEKVVHYQTSLYLTLNEILDDNQHGFRRNFSTSSAIFEFLKDIYESIRSKKVLGCVYVDYQKAFDTINHEILFKKLDLYGFSKSCVNWFKSYLTGRTQCTKSNGDFISSPKNVSLGVPQGSTLGPLLFIVYVNDICHIKYIFDVDIKMYADDTVFYATGRNRQEVCNTLQMCSNYVYDWCIVNRLYINMKKTKIMWFGMDNDKEDGSSSDNIHIANVCIERVWSYPYLGIELDARLSFDKHLDNIVSKCNQKLYVFRKIRRFVCEDTAIVIYKQTIRPLLEYCSFIFESGKKVKIDTIDKIQSKCLRIIESCSKENRERDESVLCLKYKLSTLHQRRKMQLGSIMYRYSRNELFVDTVVNRENLRSANKIKIKCTYTKMANIRKSPFYRGVDLWNSLKVEHHRAENKKRFKTLLTETLL